jgi:hypothetical protein
MGQLLMNRLSVALLLTILALTNARAGQLEVQLDARAVAVDARPSFLDGGLGKLRYGAGNSGVDLGRLRFALTGAWGETLRYNVDASAWSVSDTNPIDLTEAYLEWRPVPRSMWRSRLKLGAFYPAISLEHRAAGWTNPYLISSSALNTWVGEELRTIGLEYNLDWLGAQQGSDFEAGLTAAAYGWNDPAGVVVAFRGFALHDRQTPLFGRLRTWVPGGPQRRVLFAEIDGRAGYYAGARARYRNQIELRALHYDNRADPAAFDAAIDDYAWETRFNSAGFRYETADNHWTLIGQWLDGQTYVGPQGHDRWQFDTKFLLLARQVGKHRFAARVDRFAMRQLRSIYPGTLGKDRGDALAIGWTFEPRERLELSLEGLRVRSDYNWRRRLGEPARADERSLQLGVRYTFDLLGR